MILIIGFFFIRMDFYQFKLIQENWYISKKTDNC